MLCGDADLGDHAHNEALFFDVVRLYRVRILEDFACCSGLAAARGRVTLYNAGEASAPE